METAISIVSARKLRGGGRFPESPCGRRGGLGMKCALLSAAFGLALLPAAVFADTTWNGNVDGDFNTADNWSNGVPTTENAGVIEKTGENTISVSKSPAEKVGAFSMSNADGATTLSVTSPMELEGGKVSIGKNSEVVVGSGGELTVDLAGVASSDSDDTFELRNGGKIIVDNGGVFSLTNTTGHLRFGTNNNFDDKATLEIRDGGTVEFAHSSGNGLRLYSGSSIKMTGGTFVSRDFYQMYGFKTTIDLSGEAQMISVDPRDGTERVPFLRRDMTVKMSGNSSIRCKSDYATTGGNAGKLVKRTWIVKSHSAGQTFLLDMEDNAFLDIWGKDQLSLGSAAYGNGLVVGEGDQNNRYWTGLTRIAMRGNSGIETGTSMYIGQYSGVTGIVELAENAWITQNNTVPLEQCDEKKREHRYSLGMTIGMDGKFTDCPAVGILKMSGGSVVLFRNVELKNSRNWRPQGLVVGDAATYTGADGNVSIGRIEMTDGVISNNWYESGSYFSAFMLGVRSARGEVVQGGGRIVHLGNLPLVIGFSGGEGFYDMAGGELEISEPTSSALNKLATAGNIYVGGASITDAGYDPASSDSGKYSTYEDVEYGGRLATGTLVVSGGVVRTARSMYVSSHGYGTLEIGKAGRIEAANLYLTNSTVNGVTALAKLKVTLGESGCGKIALTGVCQIAADAQCEIDVSAFEPTEKGQTISFLECASVEGGFAAANVSVTGTGWSSYRLVATETGLSVKYNPVGLMIFVR